jgi:hypothetical protein
MRADAGDQSFPAGIPDADSVVVPSRHDLFPVRGKDDGLHLSVMAPKENFSLQWLSPPKPDATRQ